MTPNRSYKCLFCFSLRIVFVSIWCFHLLVEYQTTKKTVLCWELWIVRECPCVTWSTLAPPIRALGIIMLTYNLRVDGSMVRQFVHQLALAASDWLAGQRTVEGRKKEARLGVWTFGIGIPYFGLALGWDGVYKSEKIYGSVVARGNRCECYNVRCGCYTVLLVYTCEYFKHRWNEVSNREEINALHLYWSGLRHRKGKTPCVYYLGPLR